MCAGRAPRRRQQLYSDALCFWVVCPYIPFWWRQYRKNDLSEFLQNWQKHPHDLEDKLIISLRSNVKVEGHCDLVSFLWLQYLRNPWKGFSSSLSTWCYGWTQETRTWTETSLVDKRTPCSIWWYNICMCVRIYKHMCMYAHVYVFIYV